MAQPFFPADDEVSFDSQSKRDALPIPHTIQGDSQHDIVDRNLCINTGPDMDLKGRGVTRRRIQVACMRCRKRKIKCSGDAGDGQGCSNCRSTGSNCHFLRVNSSMLQTKVHVSTGSGWPYPASEMASQRLGTYAPPLTSSKMGGVPTSLPNNRIPPFSRPLDYEVPPDTQSPYARQAFGTEPTIDYEDGSSTPYNIQSSSAYVLPNSPQVFMADYCGLGWNSKGWGAVLQGSRAPPETMFSESDAGSPLTHPAYSYMIPGQGPQANEALTMTPAQGSLASPTQGTERTLPNPAGRSPFSGNASGPTATTNSLPSPNDFKSGSRWESRCGPRTPMQAASNIPFNTATMDRAKLIPSSGQDMTFGLLPVASSSASSPLIPSSGAFVGMDAAACATEAGDEFRGNADGRYGAFSRDNRRILSLADPQSSTYGYSRPSYRNRPEAGDSNSESTLINGLPYTRPTHSINLPQIDEKPALQAIARHPSYSGLCSQ
ncbi:hypothetical protein BDW62DRAFT_211447 [Aspergillus aurantiobrunneus]